MDLNRKTFIVSIGPMKVLVNGAVDHTAALEAVNSHPGIVTELGEGSILRERLAGTKVLELPSTPSPAEVQGA